MTVSTPLMSRPREATSVARRKEEVAERKDSTLAIRCGNLLVRMWGKGKQVRGGGRERD